ncbi:MAG: PAS domain S-box protein [Sedimentisphaerales bacterium]|nr:PAS domain S-box protein [Sedimentisphaerales bacterium]
MPLDTGKKKQNDNKLEQSESLLLETAEISGSWIWEIDQTGLYTYSSPIVEKLLGYKPEEIVGKKYFYDFFKPEIRETYKKALFEIFQRKGAFRGLVIPNVHKNGDIVILEINGGLLFDDKKNLTGYRGVNRNITVRQQRDTASWDIHESYKALMNDSILGITVVDTNYKIIMTNSTFCELFNKSAAEFAGKYCFKEYEKRDEICPHCPGRRAMATGAPAEVETQAVRDDGTRIHVRNRAIPFFSHDGQINGFIEMIENIDEKKRAQEDLYKSEERFRMAAKLASDLIWELDIKTDHLEWYGDIDGRLGYKTGEFPRTIQAWESILHPDDYDRVANELKLFLTEGEPFNTEHRIKTKNGDILYWTARGTIIYDSEGKPARGIGVCSDVTNRRNYEQRQKELMAELEKVNEELTSFAYIVSHDLKAPLRGVKVLADWLCEDYADKLGPEGKNQMELLVSRVDRMHNLIDGILQYSRIGRIEDNISEVDTQQVVTDVIDALLPPANIRITVENKLPVIMCEKTRMFQIFQNLISNAVKYMDKEEGIIKLDCAEEEDFWKFSVEDNGPGIEEKYFDKIFQMFQTLSPRDQYESTGIGLTVVKKIIELYGGKIWIESKVGNGSIFLFTIPKQKNTYRGTIDEELQTNFIS